MHETYQIYMLTLVMSSYNLPDVYLIHFTKLENIAFERYFKPQPIFHGLLLFL
jgi:hypothetical protein